jgi:hypothetical protein
MYDEPHGERNHFVGTALEGNYVKLDFGGRISFLKMPPADARKLAHRIIELSDAAEDPVQQMTRRANDALGKPNTVGLAMGNNEDNTVLTVKFTEFVNRLEFTFEQAIHFITGLQHYASRLKR